MQRASGVIRGTHTGETYLHATGDGTGAVGTFNRNAKALKGALLDSSATILACQWKQHVIS